MMPVRDIRAFVKRIAGEFHPERIILFGSYAWGNPTPDSDVDLLVVLPFQGKSWRMASEIRKRVRPPFPLDLMVRSAEQLQQRLMIGDAFFQEITRQGKVLYEDSNRRVGQ
jgi:predicted nucleotidyltransferase